MHWFWEAVQIAGSFGAGWSVHALVSNWPKHSMDPVDQPAGNARPTRGDKRV